MRPFFLSLTVATALVTAVSFAPQRADAMTVGTSAAIQAAAGDSSLVQDAAYVCRHRYYGSGRTCFWTGGYRGGWRGGWRGGRRWHR